MAPHEIGSERLKECHRLYDHSILYSEYRRTLESGEDVSSHINTLIVDNIGMLKFLYRYADVCYVGGGFGDGIHNILEAAVFDKPILFGPKYNNFAEAIELVELGGAFSVRNAPELETRIKTLLSNNQLYRDVCKISGDYVRNNSGATNTILNYIKHTFSF
jgi:3-deoxy-D-manno-octulosonic-acid transferase